MAPDRNAAALVLWDVDHTLVDVGSFSQLIYTRAFAAALDLPDVRLPTMTGRTERAILTETLAMNDVPAADGLFPRLYAALGVAAEGLRAEIRASGHALPGTHETIRRFRDHGLVQTVVTGNVRPVATVKLECFGLTDVIDLEIGGYGSDGLDRADLVRSARARAARKYGQEFPGRRTFVIGDTPHDVQGAQDADAFAVGVASGRTTVDELRDAGADLVLPDLTESATLETRILDR